MGWQNAAVLSGKHTLRVLDNLIAALQDFRDEIQDGQVVAFARAFAARLMRIACTGGPQRQKGGWLTEELASHSELPTSSQMFRQLWGGSRKPKARP